LNGRFIHQPKRVAGMVGRAVLLNGSDDAIDFGQPRGLRLAGSMTISSWVKPTSFSSEDDAAIVSSRNRSGTRAGYQLATTADWGPRTIAFKITDRCGQLAERFGTTPLVTGVWYHVAGVFDAAARTLNVYVNGQIDNGVLRGRVPGEQHSSRTHVLVGRSDRDGQEFAGIVDDIRIYSRALTKTEIASDRRGHESEDRGDEGGSAGEQATRAESAADDHPEGLRHSESQVDAAASCAISSDWEDDEIPISVAGLGLLVALAFLGFWPSASRSLTLAVSLAAGVVLLPLAASTLPPINLLLFPLTSLAGGLSVVVSVRRVDPP
jgi:hypothetical protein